MPQKEKLSAHTEVYSLLTEASRQFQKAILDSRGQYYLNPSQSGVIAGRTIFEATRRTLSYYQSEGNWPVITDLVDPTEIVLPHLILTAFNYFLESPTICLKSLGLPSGSPLFDNRIVHWSNTLLWEISAKKRFFEHLTAIYSRPQAKDSPLSDTRLRALQLLVVGNAIVKKQLEKIGQPKESKIFLPD